MSADVDQLQQKWSLLRPHIIWMHIYNLWRILLPLLLPLLLLLLLIIIKIFVIQWLLDTYTYLYLVN